MLYFQFHAEFKRLNLEKYPFNIIFGSGTKHFMEIAKRFGRNYAYLTTKLPPPLSTIPSDKLRHLWFTPRPASLNYVSV